MEDEAAAVHDIHVKNLKDPRQKKPRFFIVKDFTPVDDKYRMQTNA